MRVLLLKAVVVADGDPIPEGIAVPAGMTKLPHGRMDSKPFAATAVIPLELKHSFLSTGKTSPGTNFTAAH